MTKIKRLTVMMMVVLMVGVLSISVLAVEMYDMGEAIADEDGWITDVDASIDFSDGKAIINGGQVSYPFAAMDDKFVEFYITINKESEGTSICAIHLRNSNAEGKIWTGGNSYFVWNHNGINDDGEELVRSEMQKWLGGAGAPGIVATKEGGKSILNEDGKQYHVKFGTITEGDVVVAALWVDGELVFRYLDQEDVVPAEDSYFTIYTLGNTVTISGVE